MLQRFARPPHTCRANRFKPMVSSVGIPNDSRTAVLVMVFPQNLPCRPPRTPAALARLLTRSNSARQLYQQIPGRKSRPLALSALCPDLDQHFSICYRMPLPQGNTRTSLPRRIAPDRGGVDFGTPTPPWDIAAGKNHAAARKMNRGRTMLTRHRLSVHLWQPTPYQTPLASARRVTSGPSP